MKGLDAFETLLKGGVKKHGNTLELAKIVVKELKALEIIKDIFYQRIEIHFFEEDNKGIILAKVFSFGDLGMYEENEKVIATFKGKEKYDLLREVLL